MAFLEKFTDEHQDLLVSLPYRAGLWVSCADDEGGNEAHEAEKEALAEIIKKKSAGMFESAFIHEVMAETYTRKDDWRVWGSQIESTEEDCKKAMKIMANTLSKRDLDAYKANIMFIATEVAVAFREFGAKEAIPVKLWTMFKINIDKILGAFTGKKFESESLLNISYEEDLVLAKLSEALRVDVDDEAESAVIKEQENTIDG
jgi:hypothetical protein